MKKIYFIALSSLLLSMNALGAAASDPLKALGKMSSPFEMCKDRVMISDDDFKKNKEYWEQAIDKCRSEGVNIDVLPQLGFLSAFVNKLGSDNDATKSHEFLRRLGERITKYQTLNNKTSEHLMHCAKEDKAWFKEMKENARSKAEAEFYDYGMCDDLLKQFKKDVADYGPQFRIRRQRIEELDSLWGSAKTGMQKTVGMKNPGELVPLTEAEKQAAADLASDDNMKDQAKIQSQKDEMLAKYKSLKDANKCTKISYCAELPHWFKSWYMESNGGKNEGSPQAKLAIRNGLSIELQNRHYAEHLDVYVGALSKVPALVFLPSSKAPTNEEIAAAMGKVLENGKKELGKVQDLLADQSKKNEELAVATGGASLAPLTDKQKAIHLMELMEYGPVVQDILSEDPSQCATATTVANYLSSRDSRDTAITMVTMIGGVGALAVKGTAMLGAVGIRGVYLTNSALATASAMPFSASMYHDAHKKFLEVESRAYAVASTVDPSQGQAIGGVKDVIEARDEWTTQLALMSTGIDFVGLGAASRISERMGMPLKNALMKKGVSKAEAESLLKDLKSADKDLQMRTAKRIIQDIGLDQNELDFVSMAARKGLFTERNAEVMNNIRTQIANEVKDLGERKQVYQRAMAILEETNSAKFTDANRESVMQASVAGAEFGVKDPKYLAAKINEWNDIAGLNGLTETYKKAAQEMKKPELIALSKEKGLDAAQAKAFDNALDKMRSESGAFSDMADDAWRVQKSKLASCGLKPGV